jgi:hypothetical protein
MAERWIALHPRLHLALLSLYYFAVIVALLVLYGRGDFSTPPYIYTNF